MKQRKMSLDKIVSNWWKTHLLIMVIIVVTAIIKIYYAGMIHSFKVLFLSDIPILFMYIVFVHTGGAAMLTRILYKEKISARPLATSWYSINIALSIDKEGLRKLFAFFIVSTFVILLIIYFSFVFAVNVEMSYYISLAFIGILIVLSEFISMWSILYYKQVLLSDDEFANCDSSHDFIGKRITAVFIDYIVATMFGFFFTALSVFFCFAISFPEEKIGLVVLIVFVITGFAHFILKDVYRGISVGKRFMNIAVSDAVDMQKRLSVWRLVLRNVTYLLFPIEIIWFMVTKGKTRLGDKIGNSTTIPNSPEVKKYKEILYTVQFEEDTKTTKVLKKASHKLMSKSQMIDGTTVGLLTVMIPATILFIIPPTLSSHGLDEPTSLLIFALMVFICYSFLCARDLFGGASIGKRMTNLIVRCANKPQKKPSPMQLLLRNCDILFGVSYGLLFDFIRNDGRYWSDVLAGTELFEIDKKENLV